MVRCAACGQETPLANRRETPRNAPWLRDKERKDPAKLANPLTPEEIAAGEAVEILQWEYKSARADMGELLLKFRKARGEPDYTTDGRPIVHGRDEKLVREQDELIGMQQQIIDEVGEKLKQARIQYNRLMQLRSLRLQVWHLEQEQKATGKGKKQTGNGQDNLRKRIREVLGK